MHIIDKHISINGKFIKGLSALTVYRKLYSEQGCGSIQYKV